MLTTATRDLEHTWELWDEGGAIRVRQISRLENVMRDETYGYAYDPAADARVWRKTDNVSGVSEELVTVNNLALAGVLDETRVTRDAGGSWLGTTTRRSVRIGSGDDAVLREAEYLRETPAASAARQSEYWIDPWHAARNAKLRLRTGDDIPWSYHDWDAEGREILRIEQRNGSALPETLPLAWTFGADPVGCEGLEEAFVTAYDYTPSPEDAAHPEDAGEMRGEIRYVVRGGVATEIGRTWRTLTRVTRSGYAAVCDERVRACAAGAGRDAAGNAYSRTVTFDRSADFDVPLVVRDETAERLDEDGLLTETAVEVAGGRVTLTTRRSRGGVAFPTYDVEVRDATRGTVLLRETRLTAGDAAVASETRAYDEQDRLRSSVWLDGTSATNAFSCCRLLWSRDRQGRTVLRSAVTGEDRLYWADEDVWLADVQTNGHRVTRHFCDGFGRETNTVVCVAAVPGEATNRTSSAQVLSSSTASYADADGNWSETVDARGRRTVASRTCAPGRTVTETVTDGPGLGEDDALVERRTEWFNGDTSVFTDCRGVWSERFVETDYGADGCRTVTERTVSGTASVTNRVTRYDWLGRRVSLWTPTGETSYTYHGAGGRVDAETLTAGSVTRLRTAVYDAYGELVGSESDGVTERSETAYEENADGCLWRVERESRTSAGREILDGERRTRLTGLGATEPVPELGVGRLTAETVTFSADGLRTEERLYAGEGGLELAVSSNGTAGVTRTLRRCGVVIGRETADGAETNACDALGRTILLTRTAGGVTRPVSAYAYTPAGDVASEALFTNDVAGTVTEYAYDAFGNVVATTDALGNVVTNAYDVRGSLLATGGAAYAVRYAYDAEGRRLSSATSRNGFAWDATAWEYDPATGLRTAKGYADGTRETRSYTDDGLLLATTSPSGATRTRAYDAQRRLVSVMSPGAVEPDTFAYDAFGRMTAASGTLYEVAALLSDGGAATNEAVNAAGLRFNLRRELDGCGRVVGRGSSAYVWQTITYTASGKVASASTPHAAVAYLYDDEGRDAGCEIAVPGAPVFRRAVTRDPWTGRVLAVTNSVGGVPVCGYACAYDALGRLVAKGGETYAYNARGELTARTPAAGAGESYAYDGVGNFASVCRGGETRAYAANAANQYLGESYDADGRLAAAGGASFAYDAADRLTTVTTGGVWAASYTYDPLGRRTFKLTAEGERWYFYDGWNLVEERVFGSDGSMEIVEYAWGCDASGTLDGAGGVGGLLYVRKHGHVYVPVYDPNGSVTGYVDPSTGALVASYAYDGFGRTVAQSGPMADAFSLRYSTKYMDPETGLSYYGYRYYSPQLGRWLTRDPLEEDGGINLYGFCGNDGVNRFDKDGRAYFVKRRLYRNLWVPFVSINSKLDRQNREYSHEHLVFEDNKQPPDLGYFSNSEIMEDPEWRNVKWVRVPGSYNDCVMRKAIKAVKPKPYSLLGDKNAGIQQYNCQDFADDVRRKYFELIKDKKVLCECGLIEGKE